MDANSAASAGRVTIGAAVAAIIVVVDIAIDFTFIIIAYFVTKISYCIIAAAAVTAVVTPGLGKLAISFASGHLCRLFGMGLRFSYLKEAFSVKVVYFGINVGIQKLPSFSLCLFEINFL